MLRQCRQIHCRHRYVVVFFNVAPRFDVGCCRSVRQLDVWQHFGIGFCCLMSMPLLMSMQACYHLNDRQRLFYRLPTVCVLQTLLKPLKIIIQYQFNRFSVKFGIVVYVIDSLCVIQKRVIRHVHHENCLSHTNNLFLTSGILRIAEIHKLTLGCHMFIHNKSIRFLR